MDKVLLFSLHTEQIKVTIEAYFDSDENLVVDGYDIGKTVEEFWGDSDYEYVTTVSWEEVKKLNSLLGLPTDSKKELLLLLQSRYHTNTCYSELVGFLTKNNIRHGGFSWT